MLIVFDDIIADTLCNKKVLQIVTELFIRCRKLNISLVFITDKAAKISPLSSTHYFIMKILNK